MARRSLGDDQSIDVRKRGERGAGTRRARSSDGRTRRRWSGTGIRPPAAAAAAAALQTSAATGQRHDGADRAGVAGLLVGIVTGRAKVAGRPHWPCAEATADCATLGFERRRRLRGDPVEMSERKHELHGKRQQRHARAMSDVRSEPLHADTGLAPNDRGIPAVPTLQYNIRDIGRVSTVAHEIVIGSG